MWLVGGKAWNGNYYGRSKISVLEVRIIMNGKLKRMGEVMGKVIKNNVV